MEFEAYIEIQHASERPTNITAVALFGTAQFKEIHFEHPIDDKSLWEQIEIVREIVRQHFEIKNGKCPMFGPITGYRYFYKQDEWVEFSTDGEIKGYHTGNNKKAEAVLQIGSKRITGGLFK